MKNTTTCLIMSPDTPDAAIADYAVKAARNDTHLRCLLLGPSPLVSSYIYSVPPYGIPSIPADWGDTLANANTAHKKRAETVSAIMTQNGVSADVTPSLCAPNDVSAVVARHARASDVATISPDLRKDDLLFQEAVHGILMQSPVHLILNAAPADTFGRVFVAWNDSLAAARAVHAALPCLMAADEVIIGLFDPDMTGFNDSTDPGTDIAGWLSHHGCNVTLSQFPSGGLEIGQCIQDRATELGAHLVVLGAYGHSRMRQAVFGGTTRTMLDQSSLPVLLAH